MFHFQGYPRTVAQAEDLWAIDSAKSPLWAIHIDLEQWVVVEKLLGRRICSTCHGSFNTASILSNGYHMPAILPEDHCVKGNQCKKDLHSRTDDTKEIIQQRLDDYQKKTTPVLDYFREKNRLKSFQVKRGVDDTDDLLKCMLEGIDLESV